MKTKLTMMAAMAATCAATQLTAMPTEEETKRAEPVARKLLGERRDGLATKDAAPNVEYKFSYKLENGRAGCHPGQSCGHWEIVEG